MIYRTQQASMTPEVAAKFKLFEDKMKAEGLSGAAILAFKNSYAALSSGATGMITESSIEPATGVPSLEQDIKGKHGAGTDLLTQTVVLKLNGGLGTRCAQNTEMPYSEPKHSSTQVR